jgi:PPK2 family polyphosphate:nucleotide phosphotransferase
MPPIKLSTIDTRAPKKYDKEKTKLKTAKLLEELDELQNLLYAEGKHSVLIVIQGMDASGKDSLIRDVFGNLNPQGVMVHSYKTPTEEELKHDFLWRIHKQAPAKGMIQVFNRSHYEDILITRVHNMIDSKTAKKRVRAINDFERLLTEHSNTCILKLYLHISQEVQLERLNERIRMPHKMWKYNEKDFEESKLWDLYMNCYEDAFEQCSEVPWHIIPADQNWIKNYLVAEQLHKTLSGLHMKYPGMKK